MMFVAHTSGEARICEPAADAQLAWFQLKTPPEDLTPQAATALAALKHRSMR